MQEAFLISLKSFGIVSFDDCAFLIFSTFDDCAFLIFLTFDDCAFLIFCLKYDCVFSKGGDNYV